MSARKTPITNDEELVAARKRVSREIAQLASLKRSLFDSTVNSLSETVKALQETIPKLQESNEILRGAFFGRWDDKTNKQVVGVETRLANIERVLFIAQKFGMWVLGPILSFIFLRAIGVPTEAVGHAIASSAANSANFWSGLLTHTPPP